jgi:c-di-GMP-binding flagellar brake protein YcgR
MSPSDPNHPAEPRRERRRHLRVKVAAEIRLELQKQATPLRAKTSDISLGGCYVEMMFTLEVGTKVKLTLLVDNGKVNVDGIVVSRDLQVGNGIQFTDMAAEDNARLRRFLATVR